jgi:hypothetical protein
MAQPYIDDAIDAGAALTGLIQATDPQSVARNEQKIANAYVRIYRALTRLPGQPLKADVQYALNDLQTAYPSNPVNATNAANELNEALRNLKAADGAGRRRNKKTRRGKKRSKRSRSGTKSSRL